MINKLAPIILQKEREVSDLYQLIAKHKRHSIAQVLRGEIFVNQDLPSFKQALKKSSKAIIAEIKRSSPSKGLISPISDPTKLAIEYIEGEANALSILTDQSFFKGSIDDLTQVANISLTQQIPLLRKDFMIDPIQIAEAAVAGASAVLCIVSVLGQKLKLMLEFASAINLDVLVEIHSEQELEIAIEAGAEMIGINNRDLTSFTVDTNHALNLVSDIPNSIIKIAESGITQPQLAKDYFQAGFDAILIGEALVKSQNPAQFMRECRNE